MALVKKQTALELLGVETDQQPVTLAPEELAGIDAARSQMAAGEGVELFSALVALRKKYNLSYQ